MAAGSWQMRDKTTIKHVVITKYKVAHETAVRNGIIIAWRGFSTPESDGLNTGFVALNDTY